MKRVFWLLFNLARNISLLIVLTFTAMLVYAYYTGALQEAWAEYQAEAAAEAMQDSYANSMPVQEAEVTFQEADKISLEAPSAIHFIRPAQTAFLGVDGRYIYAVTAKGDTLRNMRSALSKIWEVMDEKEPNTFFKTRDYLVNCHFVSEYYTENKSKRGSNYVHYIVMETGDTLTIPHGRYQDFLALMEQHALQVK